MENYIPTLIPIVLAVLAGLGWLYKHEKEKRLLIEKQLSEKKYGAYYKFISIYFDLFKSVKKGQPPNTKKLTNEMIDIKKELTIYGSDEVITKFFFWEETSSNNENSLIPITDIIIEMRRDMGNPKTKITTEDFLKSLVRDKQDYQELKKKGIV